MLNYGVIANMVKFVSDFVVNDRSSLNNLNCLENYSQGFVSALFVVAMWKIVLMVIVSVMWTLSCLCVLFFFFVYLFSLLDQLSSLNSFTSIVQLPSSNSFVKMSSLLPFRFLS